MTRRRGGALAGVVAVVLLSGLLGTLVPLFVAATLVLGALFARGRSYAVGLAWAVLATYGALLAVLVLLAPLPGVGILPSFGITAAGLLVVLTAATVRLTAADAPDWAMRRVVWSAAIGPGLLLTAVGVYAVRFGPPAAWAMSGDARNHVLITEAITYAGGWTGETGTYPALHNGIAALLAVPHGSLPEGSTLAAGVAAQAGALLAAAVLLGLLAGTAAASGRTGPAAWVRAAVASAIVVSPLLLDPVLAGGFFPTMSACLLLLAGVLVTGAAPGPRPAVAGTGVAAVLLLAVFPPVAPVLGGPLLVLVARRTGLARRRQWLLWLAVAVAAAGVLALALVAMARVPQIATQLGAPGGIISVSPWLAAAVCVVALLTWFGAHSPTQDLRTAGVLTAAALLAVTVWWLSGLASSIPYYGYKTVLTGGTVLLVAALVRSPVVAPDARDPVVRSLPAVAVFVVVCFVPLLVADLGRPQPLLGIARGWSVPSAAAARLVTTLPDQRPHNYLWQVGDPRTRAPINIWLSAPNLPAGSLDLQPVWDLMQWAYRAAPDDPAPLCELMAVQPDAVVWTDTPDKQRVLVAACPGAADQVRVDPGLDWNR